MPRGINNWTYNDVSGFLRKEGFSLSHQRGSHYYFSGFKNGRARMVTVPYHGNQSIKPKTMSGIILQSGIDKKEWLGKK